MFTHQNDLHIFKNSPKPTGLHIFKNSVFFFLKKKRKTLDFFPGLHVEYQIITSQDIKCMFSQVSWINHSVIWILNLKYVPSNFRYKRYFSLKLYYFNPSRPNSGRREKNELKLLFLHFFVVPQKKCENKKLT